VMTMKLDVILPMARPETHHLRYFERREVLPRNAILNDAFELVVFCLVRPKELEKAHG